MSKPSKLTKTSQALDVARSLAGLPAIPTQEQLIRLFQFNETVYYYYTTDRNIGYRAYKRPERRVLRVLIERKILESGAGDFPGKKRPKILAGAVLKRVYPTYPETKEFMRKWEKLEADAERVEARIKKEARG